jgi:hypothetical protein
VKIQKKLIDFGPGFKDRIKHIVHGFFFLFKWGKAEKERKSGDNEEDKKRPRQKILASQIDGFGERSFFGGIFLHDLIKAQEMGTRKVKRSVSEGFKKEKGQTSFFSLLIHLRGGAIIKGFGFHCKISGLWLNKRGWDATIKSWKKNSPLS